jgi:hypothetical protein
MKITVAEENRRAQTEQQLEQENRFLRSICEQLVGEIARLHVNGKFDHEK